MKFEGGIPWKRTCHSILSASNCKERFREQARVCSGLARHRRHRCVLLRRARARPRRKRQRGLARHGSAQRLPHRLPLLQQVHRREGAAGRPVAADARRPAQRRPGLRADQQVGPVRPPLRRDRRRRPAGRACPRRADGLSSRHALDPRRRRDRRCRAGLHRPVRVRPARRQVAGRDDQDGARAHPRLARPGRRAGDHDHHPRRARAGRGQGADREPLGPVHDLRDDSDRAADGLLHALHPARGTWAKRRRSASCCCCCRS